MIPTWICIVGLGLYAVQVIVLVVTSLKSVVAMTRSLRFAEMATEEARRKYKGLDH